VVNWDLERNVWESYTSSLGSFAGVLLTEPPLCPNPLRAATYQMMFEQMGFPAVHAVVPAALALRYHLAHQPAVTPPSVRRSALVIDAGFSFSHAVPCAVPPCQPWTPRPMAYGIRRVDVGGKVLTNLLKEAISFRHWNMMEEVALVNHIKETTCFVSQDIARDIRCPGQAHYVLPDYAASAVGAVVDAAEASRLKSSEGKQILVLGNERFCVPEALFNPLDVGIDQRGIADAAAQAVEACNKAESDQLLSLVLLRGGTSRITGFAQRLEAELCALSPEGSPLRVVVSSDPVCDAWLGAKDLVTSGEFTKVAMTKREYDECGISIAIHRINPC
jgi:actin-related protein 6